MIRSYSNDDGYSNENGKNVIGLIYDVGKPSTLHQTYLYISLLFLISRTLITQKCLIA